MRADVLGPEQTARLLRDEGALIDSARPFMLALSRAAGKERHAAMLGDAHGRVLDVIGDEPSVRGPESVPGPGSLLAEANAGANGIGSTLGHGGYVELIGPEHFIEGFHPFTCQGVPLVGATGETVGVLSTSVRRLEVANRLRDILFCAAQAVECDLLSRWLMDSVVSAGPRAELAERLRQDIVQRFAAARLHLEAAARRISQGGTATALVSSARALIQRFTSVASTWRDIVAEAPDQPEVLSLSDLADAIRDLLETEARVNAIEVLWGRADTSMALADRRTTSRALLDAFLNAMQLAGAGGRVRIDVQRTEQGGCAAVITGEDASEVSRVGGVVKGTSLSSAS